MNSFKIFTVASGEATPGVIVDSFTLKGASVTIPVIFIGEEGRGRQLSHIPVELPKELYSEWKEKGKAKLLFAEIGRTKTDKPKLIGKTISDSDEKMIGIFPTMIGFRGGNSHTGDRTPETFNNEDAVEFLDFPGEILCKGQIAQGDAGRMGNGDQLIAVLSKEVVFRTSYSGRLYGAPSSHYYKFDGNTIQSFTWEERTTVDMW